MFVKIIKRPRGEAPEWVRDAWIGLRLPVENAEPRDFEAYGVLTGPRDPVSELLARMARRRLLINGYLVRTQAALTELQKASPQAAAWWRTNCPNLLSGALGFHADECEPDGDTPHADNDA